MQAISRRRSKARMAALLLAVSVGLSGCFDLTQKVAIDRSGAGPLPGRDRRARARRCGAEGKARHLRQRTAQHGHHDHRREERPRHPDHRPSPSRASRICRLSDEVISLRVLGRSLLRARPRPCPLPPHLPRRQCAPRQCRTASAAVTRWARRSWPVSVRRPHLHVLAVTLPGSILRIAPVKLGDALVVPTVTGDFYHGHTVTWTHAALPRPQPEDADLRGRFLGLWQFQPTRNPCPKARPRSSWAAHRR